MPIPAVVGFRPGRSKKQNGQEGIVGNGLTLNIGEPGWKPSGESLGSAFLGVKSICDVIRFAGARWE
jgi:hypothetical protein